MFLLNLITVILFVYLLIYSIYLLTLNIKSFGAKNFFKKDEENQDIKENNRKYCVIVWTKEKDRNPEKILYSLEAQDYNKELFDIHMINIYDNDNHRRINKSAENLQIHQVTNPEFYSKDKAISMFVEKIIQSKDFQGRSLFLYPAR